MANTGLLILSNPARVRKTFPLIKRHVFKTLYIQYIPERPAAPPGKISISPLACQHHRHFDVIANIYFLATTLLTETDVRVLLSSIKRNELKIETKKPIELVIFDKTRSNDEMTTFIRDFIPTTTKSCDFLALEGEESAITHAKAPENPEKLYNSVVLGGTFDRLHNGHKILLTKALLHSTSDLTVGVTNSSMIKSKLLWELIEPCETRMNNIRAFLEDVDSTLKYKIVPISDMYGPTKSDPTFEMIVVSQETQKAVAKINQVRADNNLRPLDSEIVNLVQDEHHRENEESKISSSNHRLRLLGTRLKEPNIAGKPLKPYIIGLTGGIASGKSSVAEKLQSLGAAIVHCDKLAHKLYAPGLKCFDIAVQMFGEDIVTASGTINRKKIGEIVFSDSEKLRKLNEAMWPEILAETLREIEKLTANGAEIIIMEAAVLIQAKWQFVCHEIWTCIIPHDEAITRLMRRNNLSASAAEQRIKVQPSNVEQVQEATVVFSTLWNHDVTLGQVQKAWELLKKFLATKI